MAEDKSKAVALMSLNATKAGMQAVDKKTVRFTYLTMNFENLAVRIIMKLFCLANYLMRILTLHFLTKIS